MAEDTEMKSPSPEPAEDLKPEDTPVKSEAEAETDGPKQLTKDDLSIMKGVTEHLAEYKDEKCVVHIDCERKMQFTDPVAVAMRLPVFSNACSTND